ncbi:MAG: aldose 1-epimerase family protein [Beijerinckiaceae bacterium]|nr:aldose 1-epimerase family protein [Beijerinckiaceae bacterium]
MGDTIYLRHGDAAAAIALRGAELQSWIVHGAERIWTPVPAIWPDSSPVLFPVVGWTREGRVTIAGRRYPLGLHGFARHLPFRLAGRSDDHACLVLEASEASRALYPYDFVFRVTYRLTGVGLRIELTVSNRGETAMPYACGLHPGFRWPFAGGTLDEYHITFAEAEAPAVPIISEGLFTRDTRPVPLEGGRLPLSAALFAHEALCFLDARSRSLRFGREHGATITVELDDFPHIALWSKPEGKFLSIEAWTGRGDDADGTGDFLTKPSMIHLPPGAERSHVAVYGFER